MGDQETKRIRYWKKEKPKDPWKLMLDTETAKKIVIRQGAMFITWTAFSEPYKGNGNPEPKRFGDLPLDFDSKDKPEIALNDVRELCLIHLPELFDLDPYDIKFYCSGSKGFHAIIPAELFGVQDGDPYLPLIYKRIISNWAEKFQISTVDHSMYAMQKGKMFRIANVKRKNGHFKVPLTLEEIRDLSINELWKLSEAPRNV